MSLWQRFCTLGKKTPVKEISFWRERKKGGKAEPVSGVEICTRLCGQAGCRCGGTMRGLHCVWSYYRDK